ncbi:hypothetical protein N7533_001702 [Penicillium manginii]|jgi:hypothetical protein|uniref:uncharacterized protein n=1 Tax=Penicillium manginii TaxID=203109 RepID=UPI0025485727|nr:uncharacterized protein N7533_001702 [Penicillium manginii]KAJ5763021.1 hypothetical protein N7533_001702 [Penicillium manginii]
MKASLNVSDASSPAVIVAGLPQSNNWTNDIASGPTGHFMIYRGLDDLSMEILHLLNCPMQVHIRNG